MAALGRIENAGDGAKHDDDARAKQGKSRNKSDGDDGQDQGVFDQGLSFPAEKPVRERSE